MRRVVDLTEAGPEPDVLTATGSGGLLGGQYLAAPPADHLEESEDPWYVLRNKTRGVSVDGAPDLDAANGYQTLAVLTDCRLLLLAGRERGDEIRSLPLSDVVEASAETDSLLESTLVVTTVEETTYRFPCRGDVTAAAEALDRAAGAWGVVERHLGDAAGAITAARQAVAEDDYETAVETLDSIRDDLEAAAARADRIGPGAAAAVTARRADINRRYEAARRHVYAERGATAHADAQAAWADHNYEIAATSYEMAVSSYRTALDSDGSEPADGTLSARLKAAARERAMLSAAPTADADAARRAATTTDRPWEAAEVWETALKRYRDALGLDWGDEPRRFHVDRGAVRERAAAVADAAVDAHREAASRWRVSGDRLAVAGDVSPDRLYERACDHVERALDLAREVRTDRVDALEADRDRLESRLAGDIPDDPPEDVQPGTLATTGPEPETFEPTAAEPGGWTGGATLPDDSLDVAPAPTSKDGPAGSWATDPPAEDPGGAFEPPTAVAIEALRALDGSALADLVVDVWTEMGWATTRTAGAVYDVLAVREKETGIDRLLLWAIGSPELANSAATVDRCRAVRDTVPDAEAVLVTAAPVPEAARDRAETAGVDIVDAEWLVERLHETDLLARLQV